MDGVVGKTNQDVTRKLAQNNCLSLDSSPRLGTILGILSLRGALKKKDLGRIEPWATTMRANSVDPARVPGPLLIAQSINDPLVAPMVTRKFAKAMRSEEHTSELQSLMRISYAVFCLNKTKINNKKSKSQTTTI